MSACNGGHRLVWNSPSVEILNSGSVRFLLGDYTPPSRLRVCRDRLEGIPHFHARNRREVAIARPDFLNSMLQDDDGDLQVKYPFAANLERGCPSHEALAKAGPWRPNVAVAFSDQVVEETRDDARRRWSARHPGVRDNAPEFRD